MLQKELIEAKIEHLITIITFNERKLRHLDASLKNRTQK